MGDIVHVEFGESGPRENVCPCGSPWFKTFVTVGLDGRVNGYRVPLVCIECGEELIPDLT